MSRVINKVAVLGAGVMGRGIAALLAGTGLQVMLLDMLPLELTDEEKKKGLTEQSPGFRNRLALNAKEQISDPKNRMLYCKTQSRFISVGNTTDHMDAIARCDWFIEAVREELQTKRALLKKVADLRKPGSIVSTNTSGVSIRAIAEGMPEDFRRHFLGTHFFNPVRHMHLLELIPCNETLPEVMDFMEDFGSRILGKGVVRAKDTPSFIANRIGTFALLDPMRLSLKYDFSIPQVDQITGQALGRAKSGTFKTIDIVGLDILATVAANLADNLPDPSEKQRFALPEYAQEQLDKGALGNKTQGGFFKRGASKTSPSQCWNRLSKSYDEVEAATLPGIRAALSSPNKYTAMVSGDAPENLFAWEHTKNILLYSAGLVPQIADDFRQIDRALVWGYGWEKGPFAVWDQLGLADSVQRMKSEGESIPGWVESLLAQGQTAFYPDEPLIGSQINLKRPAGDKVAHNEDASLLHIGDGVLCLEFHSKSNSISRKVLEVMSAAVNELEKSWSGLIIANRGKNFSVGVDLRQIVAAAEKGDWETVSSVCGQLQQTGMAFKYAPRPVVAAPFGLTLGGGAEISMHATAVTPHVEMAMGLVEAGVGVVPAGGGCKEMLLRALERCDGEARQATLPSVKKAWQTIASASVSGSAYEAIAMGMVRKTDRVAMNIDTLLDQARARVLELAASYRQPLAEKFPVLGEYGRGAILYDLQAMREGGFIGDYDAFLAAKTAFILTGGNTAANTLVSEEYILELEKEAFLSLCGEPKTQERIRHMLSTGKRLQN